MSAPTENRRAVRAWALYDFANSAFTTLVVTFIYSRFFVQGVAPDETTGTTMWTWGVLAPTALAVALLSPLLGALADRTGTRKRALALTTAVCVVLTALLFLPQRGDVGLAVGLVLVANVAFEVGMVFYNAFLPEIAPPDRIGRVSGFGWAMGYVGGLLCLVLALGLVMPETPPFGLDKASGEHVRVTTLLVAAWYALFSLPLFLTLREPAPAATARAGGLVREAFGALAATFRDLRQYRQIARLLLARLFYNDGLATIFSLGGIFAATAYGFEPDEIILFGIFLNVMAGLGAYVFGSLDDRIGGKTTILLSLALIVVSVVLSLVGTSKAWLWVAGAIVGIAAGPNQAASRSLLGRFVPADKETEFFGFFAFSGKATSFIGPTLWGALVAASGSPRAGLAVVIGLSVLGAALLSRVDEAEGRATRAAASHPAP